MSLNPGMHEIQVLLMMWKHERNMIEYCLESSIENDETSSKLDRKEQDGETNKKKLKCSKFELLRKGRAPVFWRADYAASVTLPLKYRNVNLRGHF
jgi:hypothetical protein